MKKLIRKYEILMEVIITILFIIVFIFTFKIILNNTIDSVYRDMKEKESNIYITDKYKEVWKYVIWKRNIWWWFWGPWIDYISICNTIEKKCIKWKVKWVNVNKEDIYIYIYPVMFSLEEMKNIFKDSSYSIFEWGPFYKMTWDDNDIKQFWIFTQDTMSFYSLNELKDLSKEDQNILLDLKRSPRFIFE